MSKIVYPNINRLHSFHHSVNRTLQQTGKQINWKIADINRSVEMIEAVNCAIFKALSEN